jgi:hypothetical protein
VKFSIEFGGDPQDVTITASGAADPAGFASMNERLMSDPRFRPGLAYLIDLSGVDVTELPQADAEQIAERGSENTWHYPPRAVAIVATSPRTLAQTACDRPHGRTQVGPSSLRDTRGCGRVAARRSRVDGGTRATSAS